MATAVLIQDEVEIPLGIDSLPTFPLWAASDAFPLAGRIDFVDGRIEVEMSPNDILRPASGQETRVLSMKTFPT